MNMKKIITIALIAIAVITATIVATHAVTKAYANTEFELPSLILIESEQYGEMSIDLVNAKTIYKILPDQIKVELLKIYKEVIDLKTSSMYRNIKCTRIDDGWIFEFPKWVVKVRATEQEIHNFFNSSIPE